MPDIVLRRFISGFTEGGHGDGRDRTAGDVIALLGGPFLVWHSYRYAEPAGGDDGTGWHARAAGEHRRWRRRAALASAFIDAIHDGSLAKAKTPCDPIFDFAVAPSVRVNLAKSSHPVRWDRRLDPRSYSEEARRSVPR